MNLNLENDMHTHHRIDYLEFPVVNMEATKSFFTMVFGWQFIDYGPEYSAFSNAGIDGGFYQSELSASSESGSVLVIFYSEDLSATQAKIQEAGGLIVKPLFAFPGGMRFHFTDPSGNEFAVWSDAEPH